MTDEQAVVRLRAAIEALLECRESDGDEAEAVVAQAQEAMRATRANVEPVLYYVWGCAPGGEIRFYVEENGAGELRAGVREQATLYPLREAQAMARRVSEAWPRLGVSLSRSWALV